MFNSYIWAQKLSAEMPIVGWLLRRFRAIWQRGIPHARVTTFNVALPVLPDVVASIIEESRRSLASGEPIAAVRDAIITGANIDGFIVNRYGDFHIWSVRTFDE